MTRIAIIGSGIAGLTCAHHLHRQGFGITLYEANDYVGGHTATVDVDHQGQHYAVDTGFIVFNDWTYPNFIALLNELGVPWANSAMSFSLRCERTGLEYNGTSVNSLFAQRRNALRPKFLRMIADILRFNADAKRFVQQPDPQLTLAEYLKQGHYSAVFIEHYIVPMGRAIWSATEQGILGCPAQFFIEFFHRHGFLNVNNRPVWRVVQGGSREYVRKLTAPFMKHIRLNARIASVHRSSQSIAVRTVRGEMEHHDYVIFACHSNQALRLLEQPSPEEQDILGAFAYQPNQVTLHTDTRLLPRRPLARAAWNYHLLDRQQDALALTYDMNVLQNLTAPVKFLVTLNREQDIDASKILSRYEYDHPVYTTAAVAAQARHGQISGVNRSFYCGAYWRCGFHEDGVVSALTAVQQLQACLAATPLLRASA